MLLKSLYSNLLFLEIVLLFLLLDLENRVYWFFVCVAFLYFEAKRYTFVSALMVLLLIYVIHRQDSIYFYAIFLGSFLNELKKSSKLKVVFFFIGFYFGGSSSKIRSTIFFLDSWLVIWRCGIKRRFTT